MQHLDESVRAHEQPEGCDATSTNEFLDRVNLVVDAYMSRSPSPLGRAYFRAELSRMIRNRSIHESIVTDVDVNQRQPGPRILITGLPRTGSTLLHHLLTKALKWNAPKGYDLHFLQRGAVGSNTQAVYNRQHLIRSRSSELLAAHSMSVRSAEECTVGLANHLVGLQALVQWDLPDDCSPWCGPTFAAGLRCYNTDLQRLAPSTPSDVPLVLKSPGYIFDLPRAIVELQPAVIVLLDREMDDVIESWTKLVSLSQSLFGLTPDPAQIVNKWRPRWEMAQATVARFSDDTSVEVLKFHYREIVNDATSVCCRIGQALGVPTDQPRLSRCLRLLQMRHIHQNTPVSQTPVRRATSQTRS